MEATPRELRTYETESGTQPFWDWLERLRDQRGQAAVFVRIDRLELGNLGDSKPLGDGLRELRIDVGPGYRVYIGEDGPTVILLLVGGDKKTQRKDIETARLYWEDYRRNK